MTENVVCTFSIALALVAWTACASKPPVPQPFAPSERVAVDGIIIDVPIEFQRSSAPEAAPVAVGDEVYPRVENIMFAASEVESVRMRVNVFPDARFYVPRFARTYTLSEAKSWRDGDRFWVAGVDGRRVDVFLSAEPDVWHIAFESRGSFDLLNWAEAVLSTVQAGQFAQDELRIEANDAARSQAAARRRRSYRPAPNRALEEDTGIDRCVEACVEAESSGPGDANPTRTCEERCAGGGGAPLVPPP